jgi:hypothetical protein
LFPFSHRPHPLPLPDPVQVAPLVAGSFLPRADRYGSPCPDWLIDCEKEAVEALQAAIEPTGREGRSEALEHLIMRKQAQIDFLERARTTG